MSRRVKLAFIVAPLITPLVFWLALIRGVWESGDESFGLVEWMASLPGVVLVGAPVAYLATTLLGIPMFFYLRRAGHLSFSSVTLVSFIIGLLVGRVLYNDVSFLWGVAAVAGASSGIVFWYLGVRPLPQDAAA